MSDQLRISWHDSNWIPHLNPRNILEYFCQKSNPFYDKACNNEIARMQRLSPEQMLMMVGIEYNLLHVQEPILYVIRKQDRTSPDTVTPLVDYYILAGVVYQAPDLNSIIQSRVLNSCLNLRLALDEFQSINTFNPTASYTWKHRQQQHQQAMASSKSSSTSKAAADRQQAPNEYTRFQYKIGSLLANFGTEPDNQAQHQQ